MKAVFLDRDGVINENRPDHVKGWEEFRFLPGAAESLAQLHKASYLVFVVTNQAVVNRGRLSRREVHEINGRMVQEIERKGGRIAEVLCCPHRPEEYCQCRKPKPGLLYQAAVKYSLNLQECYLVGDAVSDIAAGLAAGCRSFLVLTGRGWRQFLSPQARQLHGYRMAWNLEKAVQAILREEEQWTTVPDWGPALAHGDYASLAGSGAMTLSTIEATAMAAGDPGPKLRLHPPERPALKVHGQRLWQDGTLVAELWGESFARGPGCRLKVVSGSMRPLIEPGDRVMVRKVNSLQIRVGDIVAFRANGHMVVHRVIGTRWQEGLLYFRQKGDAAWASDLVPAGQILAKVVSIERKGSTLDLESLRWRLVGRMWGLYSGLAAALHRGKGRWLLHWAGRIKRLLGHRRGAGFASAPLGGHRPHQGQL